MQNTVVINAKHFLTLQSGPSLDGFCLLGSQTFGGRRKSPELRTLQRAGREMNGMVWLIHCCLLVWTSISCLSANDHYARDDLHWYREVDIELLRTSLSNALSEMLMIHRQWRTWHSCARNFRPSFIPICWQQSGTIQSIQISSEHQSLDTNQRMPSHWRTDVCWNDISSPC